MTVTRAEISIDWRLADNFRVQTRNLDLIPVGPKLADAEREDRALLSQMLNARVPDAWPPEVVTDDGAPDGKGWLDWYVVKRYGAVLIGIAGLKGWPDVSRSVQMGCAFLPEFQKQGHGTEAVDGLASWALTQPQVEKVVAETPVGNRGAASVLRKLGFVQIASDDAGLLRFEKAHKS